jgi:hypothetical protein
MKIFAGWIKSLIHNNNCWQAEEIQFNVDQLFAFYKVEQPFPALVDLQ